MSTVTSDDGIKVQLRQTDPNKPKAKLQHRHSESIISVGSHQTEVEPEFLNSRIRGSRGRGSDIPATATWSLAETVEVGRPTNERVAFIVGTATALIFLSAFILIAVTLKITPQIDEKFLETSMETEEGQNENLEEPPNTQGIDLKVKKSWTSDDALVPPPIPKHHSDDDNLDDDSTVSSAPTYKDMATWTVEDDMPSPMDSSTPMDSPDLGQLRRFKHYSNEPSQAMPLPPHPYLNSPTEPNVPSSSTCFTVSSQLQSREARLYENLPPLPSKSGIESLGLVFHPPLTSHPSPHGAEGVNPEFLSVSDFLNGGGGGGSRSSWVDSGRESLSFDGESGNTPNNSNSNNSNSSRNAVGGGGGAFFFQNDFSPSHHTPYPSKLRPNGDGRKSRRDRLVRQKHAIDENQFPYQFQPLTSSPTSTSGGGGVSSMCSYLAVPSPRRTVLSSGIASTVALAAASPISLHRHPNSQQMLLQENKKTRGLIPGSESPYSLGCATEDRKAGHFDHIEGHLHGGSFNEHVRLHRMSRSPSRGHTTGGTKYKVQHSTGCARYKPDSFDYGELPSHQMYPKRHLLPTRQFSQPYGGQVGVNAPTAIQSQQNHRSFPANLLSSVAPRSCSMGDLTGVASPGSQQNGGGSDYGHHVTIPSGAGQSNGSHLVASLPLPPSATSVTYEFSLAPVSGTLAPGWHLTAVQRGLATAVPLAAAVARRRLPRPRPIRQRFGFTDKTEARRAKCTIAVTALGLLAMSMLLVGITLRLAPLIDDLGKN